MISLGAQMMLLQFQEVLLLLQIVLIIAGILLLNSFDITATDFTNSGTISANTTLNTTVSSTESGSFNNTGGVVSADTVSLSVAGDFDYVADYLNNGTITTNSYQSQCRR